MYLPSCSSRFLGPLFQFLVLAAAAYANKNVKPFNCKGGSIYFAAHPADLLLYQNPDIFRDLFVWKCTTAVLFTSGGRGVKGNYSRGIESGLEDAFAYMATTDEDSSTGWTGTDVQFDGKLALLRSLKAWPQVQLLFLRLPDGKSDGKPYRNDGQSLKQLYDKDIPSICATDESATYTLDSLKDLIATILQKREPNDIRILKHKEALKKELEYGHDHTDHLVAAKLVAEVVERENITANVIAYASGDMHKLPSTLNYTHIVIKKDTYMQYAVYDRHVCREDMLPDCNPFTRDEAEYTGPDDDDTGYLSSWIAREYYVT